MMKTMMRKNNIIEKYNTTNSNILKSCRHKQKSAGKLDDGTKLVWMYYNEYTKMKGGENDVGNKEYNNSN